TTGSQSPAHGPAGDWLRGFLRVARLRRGLHLLPLHPGRAEDRVPPRVPVVRDRAHGHRAAHGLVRVCDGSREGALVHGGARHRRRHRSAGKAAGQRGRGDGHCGRYPATPDLDRGRPRSECVRDRHRPAARSEEHTSELQSRSDPVCRLLLEKKKINLIYYYHITHMIYSYTTLTLTASARI